MPRGDHASPDHVEVVERALTLGDVRLNVASAGTGPPVVLLHGFPDSWHLWGHQIQALAAAGHHVVAPDLRGFGASDRPADVAAYALPRLVGDLVALLDELAIQRVAVVGHDWGAVLAWAFTSAHPERVSRLAVVSVGHPAARAQAGVAQRVRGLYVLVFLVPGLAERLLPLRNWAWLRWVWGSEGEAGPDLARQIADLSRPGALAAALSWYRANVPRKGRAESPRRARRAIGCPVLGVWSSGDKALTERQMTGSAAHVAGPWRYERIDGANHWVPVTAGERLSQLLVDFCAPDVT